MEVTLDNQNTLTHPRTCWLSASLNLNPCKPMVEQFNAFLEVPDVVKGEYDTDLTRLEELPHELD